MYPDVTEKMRADWNDRARQNAAYYVQNAQVDWNAREFFRSGEINVANEILPDMPRICGGDKSPLDLKVVEIGCGVGRMTRMLARIFGHVTAVDVSDEMLKQASVNTADLGNVKVALGDGCTLSGLETESYDFAFSFIVFQHIPSLPVIESYCREVFRILKPGGLFKFQVQGYGDIDTSKLDSWLGVPISPEDAVRLAGESGFAIEGESGAGTQYYWLWFRKPAAGE